jgi:hypothetical protein
MAMKRRGFLSLLSGAALAPALPLPAVSAARAGVARTGYARLLAGLADYHAHVNGVQIAATPAVFRVSPKPMVKEGFDRFTRWLERRSEALSQPEPEPKPQACEMRATENDDGKI